MEHYKGKHSYLTFNFNAVLKLSQKINQGKLDLAECFDSMENSLTRGVT